MRSSLNLPTTTSGCCFEPTRAPKKVIYPALMLLVVWRIVLVRVRPDVLLSFEPCDRDTNDGIRIGGRSRLRSAWRTGNGLFSSADKGQWETIGAGHLRSWGREIDWFRVGFEPVFASYTKRGVWFVVISLLEVGIPLPSSTAVLDRAGVENYRGGSSSLVFRGFVQGRCAQRLKV